MRYDLKTVRRDGRELPMNILRSIGGVCPAGDEQGDSIVPYTCSGKLLEEAGQDVAGRCRSRDIVEDNSDPRRPLGNLSQRRRPLRMDKRLTDLV
jgi:hypothetical protein